MTMAKIRKPTEAQRRALVNLVEGTPHGIAFWYEAKQVEHEATWRACANAGWVELTSLAGGETIARVKITDAGRRWADPVIRGRAEAAAEIEQIKRDAEPSAAEVAFTARVTAERRRLLACGFRRTDVMARNNVLERLHAEARAEDARRGEQVKRDAHSSDYWERATRDLPREPAWKGSEA